MPAYQALDELRSCLLQGDLILSPAQALVVEAALNLRFDDLEVGRDIEVTRGEETEMPDVQHLARSLRQVPVPVTMGRFDSRQNGIPYGLEGLCNQRRTDRSGRTAAPEGKHAPPPVNRNRGDG